MTFNYYGSKGWIRSDGRRYFDIFLSRTGCILSVLLNASKIAPSQIREGFRGMFQIIKRIAFRISGTFVACLENEALCL